MEAEVIGRIVVGYGEVEYAVCNCLSPVVGNLDTALRVLFRLRSEDMKIQVADALLRPEMEKAGLLDKYARALGALRFSKSIRNQYAHAHWLDDGENGLFFTNMGRSALTAVSDAVLIFHKIDPTLLAQQEDYLDYTAHWFVHLGHEIQLKRGTIPKNPLSEPKVLVQPARHIKAALSERLRENLKKGSPVK